MVFVQLSCFHEQVLTFYSSFYTKRSKWRPSALDCILSHFPIECVMKELAYECKANYIDEPSDFRPRC
jgi:hypothetical protein